MALPPERVDRLFAGMGCHTIGDFKAHIRNTMLGHISLNVISPAGMSVNTEQMEFVKHCTDIYKSFIRPFLSQSKIYHHTPDLSEGTASILEISAPDKSRSAITVIETVSNTPETVVVKPKGIDGSKNYKIILDNDNTTFTLTGYLLKTQGIEVYIDSSLSSELILIEEI